MHARIVALLLLAIVAVVGFATYVGSHAYQPPLPEATVEPVAKQLHLLAGLVERCHDEAIAAGVVLQPQPAPGPVYPRSTPLLNKALARTGPARTAVVTRAPGSAVFKASVQLSAEEWLVAEIPELSPPLFRWPLVTSWLFLIVAGSAAVSIFAASKIIRPLRLLEEAVSQADVDGVLPHVPEDGASEVRATARALNRLSERLQSEIGIKMRLVAAAGHDLRTPMARMRLRAEYIADETERAKWLADLQELDQIADSAITLVKEESSRDSFEATRIDLLIEDVANELSQLGYEVGTTALAPLSAAAAPLALKRALRNLIVNAATHGKGATINLVREDDMAKVEIYDDGPGIPEHMLEQVFEPFFRVDSARRKTVPGAGLGLAIAKQIIGRFGGTITAANRSGGGLLQTVTLPLANDRGDRA